MVKLEDMYHQISSYQNGEWRYYDPRGYDAILEHFRNQVAGYGEWAIFADIGGGIGRQYIDGYQGCYDAECVYIMRRHTLACSKGFQLPEVVYPVEVHYCDRMGE